LEESIEAGFERVAAQGTLSEGGNSAYVEKDWKSGGNKKAMCILLGLRKRHPDYPLILIANRDEFYARPSQRATWWGDQPEIFAGRDLAQGGTWLGVNRSGRIAVVTSYRDPENFERSDVRSRGLLVRDFLCSREAPLAFFEHLPETTSHYNGFNLVGGDLEALYCWSNRDGVLQRIPAGCFGLSNHLLDTAWPKVAKGKHLLEEVASAHGPGDEEALVEALFEILKDREIPPDALLPDTGIGLEAERFLSPIFVESDDYGTRCSTVVLMRKRGELRFEERWFPDGLRVNEEVELASSIAERRGC